MKSNKNSSFKNRFLYALHGVSLAVEQESSLRIQSFVALGLFVFCLYIKPSPVWCAIFIAMVALVISLELVNTAVEALLDKIHPTHDSAIGFAKDCLAGAVLTASVGSVFVFGFFVWTRL